MFLLQDKKGLIVAIYAFFGQGCNDLIPERVGKGGPLTFIVRSSTEDEKVGTGEMCPLLLKSFVESMEQAMESTKSDVDFWADYKAPFHASPSIATASQEKKQDATESSAPKAKSAKANLTDSPNPVIIKD